MTSSEPRAPGRVARLVLHAGDHKTGSTTIQNAFAAGRVGFGEKRICYPAELNHNHLLGHLQPPPGAQQGRRGKPQGPGLARLARIIAESGADFALLSAEALENVPAARVETAVRRHLVPVADTLRVVAYVRPHAERLLSGYAEQVKIGWLQDGLEAYFDQTLDNRRFFYQPRFADWAARFGADFVLRPMIRSELKAGSVLEDFIETGFGPVPHNIAPGPEDNASLGLRDLMVVKFVQSRFQDKGRWLRHTLGWEMQRLLAAQGPGPAPERLRLPRALALRAAETYGADARAMDQAFFGGRPLLQDALARAVDEAADQAQPLDPEAWLSDEERRGLVLLCDLVRAMMTADQNWSAHFRALRVAALTPGADGGTPPGGARQPLD